jgi:hypothetical protein
MLLRHSGELRKAISYDSYAIITILQYVRITMIVFMYTETFNFDYDIFSDFNSYFFIVKVLYCHSQCGFTKLWIFLDRYPVGEYGQGNWPKEYSTQSY